MLMTPESNRGSYAIDLELHAAKWSGERKGDVMHVLWQQSVESVPASDSLREESERENESDGGKIRKIEKKGIKEG